MSMRSAVTLVFVAVLAFTPSSLWGGVKEPVPVLGTSEQDGPPGGGRLLASSSIRASDVLPYDAFLHDGAVLKLPQAGLDFLAEQLRFSLQTAALKSTIQEALEGQYFILNMPVFGGDFRVTVPCGFPNTQRNQVLADDEFAPPATTRPWCPYVVYNTTNAPAAEAATPLSGQIYVPLADAGTDRAFRYTKVDLDIASFPLDGLASPRPNSLFGALYLQELEGERAQLDVIPDHPILFLNTQIPYDAFYVVNPSNPTGDRIVNPFFAGLEQCYDTETEVLRLHIFGDGCSNDFIATLEAELVTGGQLKPYFENNTLFVLVNDFHTRLLDLQIIVQDLEANPALTALFDACDATGLDCSDQQEQVDAVLENIYSALGQAATGLFERELNAALSSVLMDGINQLMFDKEKDGEPDPVVDLDAALDGVNELLGTDFLGGFFARYESTPEAPAEATFILDGGVYASSVDECIGTSGTPSFRYSHLELDGNTGHDRPVLGEFIPGTTKTYEVGAAVSDDLLNQLIYNVWLSGLLCITVSPHDPALPPELASLLSTKSFAPFLPWLTEMAPDAPVLLTVEPREAPYVELGDVGDGSLLRIVAPSLHVNLYVETGSGQERRPMRVFGLATDITAAVDVEAINFTSKPLIDMSIGFDSSNRVVFNDLRPEESRNIETLIPAVLDLLGSQLASAAGNLDIPLLQNCLGGIDQRDLVLHSSGRDPDSNLDNFLEVYLNFQGYLDFNSLITSCLFSGAPAMADVFDLGIGESVDVGLLGIDSERPWRMRVNNGFWSRLQTGEWPDRPMLDGVHALEIEQDGMRRLARITVDRAAPSIHFTEQGRTVQIRAADVSPVRLQVNEKGWHDDELELRLQPGRHVLQVRAVDAAGHETVVVRQVDVASERAGCASSGPVGFVPALLTGLLVFVLRRVTRTEA